VGNQGLGGVLAAAQARKEASFNSKSENAPTPAVATRKSAGAVPAAVLLSPSRARVPSLCLPVCGSTALHLALMGGGTRAYAYRQCAQEQNGEDMYLQPHVSTFPCTPADKHMSMYQYLSRVCAAPQLTLTHNPNRVFAAPCTRGCTCGARVYTRQASQTTQASPVPQQVLQQSRAKAAGPLMCN
jgi:hypothetical protein